MVRRIGTNRRQKTFPTDMTARRMLTRRRDAAPVTTTFKSPSTTLKKRKLDVTNGSVDVSPRRRKPGIDASATKTEIIGDSYNSNGCGYANDKALAKDTKRFLSALRQDEDRFRANPTFQRWFQLPFKPAEVKVLEARQFDRVPPAYGKISKCVYVSNSSPIVNLPVHKCDCYLEASASTRTTKRATQIATTKALKAHSLLPRSSRTGSLKIQGTTKTKHLQHQQQRADMRRYCGENCYNRMLFISCTEATCSAPDPELCSNRAIQRREVKSVRVEYIPGPGFGLIANELINAGEFIIEYVGEVIDDAECERRLIKYRDSGETHFYMLELEKDIVIDARYRSNESRFINHSCDPNSMTQKWNVGGVQRIGIFARRTILPSEEITIDYNFSHFGEAVDCKCGSASCSGKIGLKRSEASIKKLLVPKRAHTKKNELFDASPPELKRPVHVSSLALLKSAQLDDEWLSIYGFKKRRLFLSHELQEKKYPNRDTSPTSSGNISEEITKTSSSTSSPVSDWSLTTEEDLSAEDCESVNKQCLKQSNWYENVVQGIHLAEMRTLQSYSCGGKSDWTKDLQETSPTKRHVDTSNQSIKVTTAMRKDVLAASSQHWKGKLLKRKRLSLLEARARFFSDLISFANGNSKWNQQIPSSSNMDPDRIFRFVKQMKNGQRFYNEDQNDLNEDACYRCGLAGELICCDGCPRAFHLCCANLVIVPPANVPWFCSECKNPKNLRHMQSHVQQGEADVLAVLSEETSSRRRQLRTHATLLMPSQKKIFYHPSAKQDHIGKRRYKKRLKASDRSYRMLEQLPLPSWQEEADE